VLLKSAEKEACPSPQQSCAEIEFRMSRVRGSKKHQPILCWPFLKVRQLLYRSDSMEAPSSAMPAPCVGADSTLIQNRVNVRFIDKGLLELSIKILKSR